MSSEAEIECKKACVLRCFGAIVMSIALHYMLLSIFLLFVNFDILHPLSWLRDTFYLIFSLSTWLCICPLISAVVLYGIFIGNSHLTVRKFYSTRFQYIRGTFLRKIAAAFVHSVVGFVTAWLYTRFLVDDYKVLLADCFEGVCLNDRYVFLILSGVYAALFFFVRERLNKERELKFPIIQQCKYIQIRSQLYKTLRSSLLKSFIPTLCYTFLYWTLGWIIAEKIANVFGVEVAGHLSSLYTILINFRLIIYVWILSSQILSSMYLMDFFFTVLLTQQIQFAIQKDAVCLKSKEVTIVEALSLSSIPIARHLASLDLFNLANSKNLQRRQQIFALSNPGGHPYNWYQLSGECLSIINNFTTELAESLKEISAVRNISTFTNIKPKSASEAAEKILLRQYNESYGIRKMTQQCPPAPETKINSCKRVQDTFDNIGKSFEEAYHAAFRAIPGLCYFFGKQEGARTIFILSQTQDIIWITQGLAAICVSSLVEDRYGVVQSELPAIIKALLKLKLELDKASNISLNGKRMDRNCFALRSAVKRSLYKICTGFNDYIKDLIDDNDDWRILQCFMNYQEA